MNKIKPKYMTESEVMLVLQSECDDVIKHAKTSVGNLIQQSVFERGDDKVGICNDCLTILGAFVRQMSAWQDR